MAFTNHPYLVPRLKKEYGYIFTTTLVLHACSRVNNLPVSFMYEETSALNLNVQERFNRILWFPSGVSNFQYRLLMKIQEIVFVTVVERNVY